MTVLHTAFSVIWCMLLWVIWHFVWWHYACIHQKVHSFRCISAVALRISGFAPWKQRTNKRKKKTSRPWTCGLNLCALLSADVLKSIKICHTLLHFGSSCEYLQLCYVHVGLFIAELLRKELTERVTEVRSCVLEVTVSTVELSHCCMFVVQILKTGIHGVYHWSQNLQEATMKQPCHAIPTLHRIFFHPCK